MLRILPVLILAGLAIAPIQASEASLRADVEKLAGDIGPRSVFQGDSLARTANYIAKRFESQGWEVRRQSYQVNGVTCDNLEVERRGSSLPAEIVVIGAHYDTVPSTPGADDNASGVAALLALAEAFQRAEPQRTLRFVAFANEEPIYFQTSLMGSRVYAKACRERGENIAAMVSLECVGFFSDEKRVSIILFPLSLFYPSRGDFIAVVGNRESGALVKQVSRQLAVSKAIPTERASLPGGMQGIGWSDHWAFWQEGYAAVMVTNTALFRNPHYHQITDTPETLDFGRLDRVVTGMIAVVKDLAKVP